MKNLILTIDIGTTGCRTMIFDKTGSPVSRAYEEYQSIFRSPTWIDHDPATWIKAALNTIKESLSNLEFEAINIAAVAVTSQRATFIPVDKKGEPVDNAILWQDKRAGAETEYLKKEIGEDFIYNKTGLNIDPYFTLPKLLWVKNNKNQIYRDMFKILTVDALIINMLTDQFIIDWTQASRTMLFNLDELEWEYNLCKRLEIDINKLPEPVAPGSIVGEVKPEIEKETGLPAGIPVITAGGDQQCAALGLGIIKSNLIEANTGTGSFVLAHTKESIRDDKKRVLCSAASKPGEYVLEAGIFTTGAVYRWFRDNFAEIEQETASKLNIDPYQILDNEADKAEVGSEGLMLIPHFAASAAPYWNRKSLGVLFGLTLGHDRSDVIRAFLEGIVLEINKNIQIMENLTGAADEIRVSGGATGSNLFNQIQADVYGKPVIRTNFEESSALGAAALAAESIGLYSSLEQSIEKMVSFDKTSRKYPDSQNHKLYQKIGEIHDEIYRALEDAGIYEKVSELEDMKKNIKQ